jgi:hypothetical protein
VLAARDENFAAPRVSRQSGVWMTRLSRQPHAQLVFQRGMCKNFDGEARARPERF